MLEREKKYKCNRCGKVFISGAVLSNNGICVLCCEIMSRGEKDDKNGI